MKLWFTTGSGPKRYWGWVVRKQVLGVRSINQKYHIPVFYHDLIKTKNA